MAPPERHEEDHNPDGRGRKQAERPGSGGERGAGLLSTVFGLAVLLGLLGVVVNVSLGLWERTTTESIAYEAARAAATAPGDADVEAVRAQALDRACALLGPRCAEVTMRFTDHPTDAMVELHVDAPGVRLLPAMVADAGPIVADLHRRIRLTREAPS